MAQVVIKDDGGNTTTKKNETTTSKTVTVGGRNITVNVPTQNATSKVTSAPNPTVGGRTVTQKNTPSKQAADKIETGNVLNERKSIVEQKIQENPDYAYDLYEFKNADGSVVSGRDYKSRVDQYESGVVNLNNSYVSLVDQYRSDGDVGRYLKGLEELNAKGQDLDNERTALEALTVSYNDSASAEYENNKTRMQQIVQESSFLKKYDANNARLDSLNRE